MDERTRIARSKFLSYVLRHHPDSIELSLDRSGWAGVDDLLARCAAHGRPLSRAELAELVATSPKQRFALSEDGQRIRASQGHSIAVELDYAPAEPPAVLFHGTVARALPGIRSDGLRRLSRHHVHLSADEATARSVGGRRGVPVILRVDALRMHRDGRVFYRAANGVWLVEAVPVEYLGWPP